MTMHSYLEVEATARAIAQRPDVVVTFANTSTAYVKYEDYRFQITLPMSARYSDRTIALMRGYLDHELGHIRYTPRSYISTDNAVTTISNIVVSKGFPKNLTFEYYFRSFAHNVWNILEDTRIEAAMGRDYPGSRFNLLRLNRELFPADPPAVLRWTPSDTSSYPAVVQDATNYLLRACMGRLHNFDAGDRSLGQTLGVRPQALQDLVHDIDAIVDEAIKPDQTSYGVLELSARYIIRLKSFLVNHNDDQQGQQGQPQQGQGQQGDQQREDGGQSGGQQGQQSGGQQGQQAGGQQGQSQAGPSGSRQTSGGGGSGGAGSGGMSDDLRAEMHRQMEEACNSLELRIKAGNLLGASAYADIGDLPKEEQERMEQELIGQRNLSSEMSLMFRDTKGYEVFSGQRVTKDNDEATRARIRNRAQSIQHAAAGQLQRLFQAATQVRSHPSEFSGRLNTSALYRTGLGDRRVFLSREARQKNNCKIIFLLDISGSMYPRIANCSAVVWGMRQATRSVPGVQSAVYAYNSLGVYRLADWGQASAYSKPATDGSTPSGAVLQYVRRFFPKDDSRKVVFLCTDGFADSESSLRQSLKLMAQANVEVYGVGIGPAGSSCVEQYFDEAHRAVSEDAPGFAHALRVMLATMARNR